MGSTERALEKFATAIEAYAQHLASHTSAIQGLSEASQELKKSSAEQNRVLMHLMENIDKAETKAETRPETTEPELSTEEFTTRMHGEIKQPEKAKPQAGKPGYPPGCFKSRKNTPENDTLQAG